MTSRKQNVTDKFNVPEEVTVGYRKYKVLYRPKRKTDLYGECDTIRAEISIFGHKDRPSIANTFLHENLHAIYKESRLQDRVGEEHEEDIVRTLTDGLSQWIVANPEATVWLLKQLGVIDAVSGGPAGQIEAVSDRGVLPSPDRARPLQRSRSQGSEGSAGTDEGKLKEGEG